MEFRYTTGITSMIAISRIIVVMSTRTLTITGSYIMLQTKHFLMVMMRQNGSRQHNNADYH